MATKTGLDALLTPERSALLLIDHQAFQFAYLHSHEPTLFINNAVGLAKAASAFKVPTILTTVTEERGGHLLKDIQDVGPGSPWSSSGSSWCWCRCTGR
jgi:nicotinamidase-related amidase